MLEHIYLTKYFSFFFLFETLYNQRKFLFYFTNSFNTNVHSLYALITPIVYINRKNIIKIKITHVKERVKFVEYKKTKVR